MKNIVYGILSTAGGLYSLYEVFRGIVTGDLSVAWNFKSETFNRKQSPFKFWWMAFWNSVAGVLFLLVGLYFLFDKEG
jgi:hypothetical protein